MHVAGRQTGIASRHWRFSRSPLNHFPPRRLTLFYPSLAQCAGFFILFTLSFTRSFTTRWNRRWKGDTYSMGITISSPDIQTLGQALLYSVLRNCIWSSWKKRELGEILDVKRSMTNIYWKLSRDISTWVFKQHRSIMYEYAHNFTIIRVIKLVK